MNSSLWFIIFQYTNCKFKIMIEINTDFKIKQNLWKIDKSVLAVKSYYYYLSKAIIFPFVDQLTVNNKIQWIFKVFLLK